MKTMLDNGTIEYRNEHGKRHREDGPATTWTDGTKEWYLHGNLHREDGPALIYPNGSESWWIHGKRHREDGPAATWPDGSESWYLHDKRIDFEFTSLKDLYEKHPEYMI
jgi:hypothetical protein